MASQFSNNLKDETSPYLLQHANNPVDWYPWCEQALEKARREDKPILLSIGYSACHWCHVMAHESFEDDNTAAVMNKLFVNIKVDREERPDLDKIYQLAHQMLTQRPGGWPLTLFLTPHDHVPFFAGTYFPKQPNYQMPPFVSILKQTAEYYHQQNQGLEQHNTAFIDAIRSVFRHTDTAPPDKDLLTTARNELEQSFDSSYGGFGQAPKFPHCSNMEFLLRHWFKSKKSDSQALEMSETTLRKMAEGGIYDQLGGGFCRYSVDDYWLIPHFEKMLYDNGPLLTLYCQSWQITNSPLFEKTVLETAEWIMREMQSTEGGYFSSLDADSEGQEGKFYAWDRDQIKTLLSEEQYRIVQRHFGLTGSPNFENSWHLHVAQPLETICESLGKPLSDIEQQLNSARKKLFLHRKNRIRPSRDEKILTSWNALTVKAMAIAARVFEREEYADSAQRAIDFIRSSLWTGSKLLATYKDGKAHLNAYLDDYAYSIDACLELLQTRWRTVDLVWAIQLADVLLQHFEDELHGGFFFTSDDHESLIQRPKSMMDESMPAGNGIAAVALARLGHLIGNDAYLNASRRVLEACSTSMKRAPHAHGSLLIAMEEQNDPPHIIVIRGQQMEQWRHGLTQHYVPNRLCFAIPDSESELPGILNERNPGKKTTAYVCTASACLPPFTDFTALQQALKSFTL